MNVAILSESEADDAVLQTFVEALAGSPVEFRTLQTRRGRSGYSSLRAIAIRAYREAYYSLGVDLFIVAFDSDESPIHVPDHAPESKSCRLCDLMTLFSAERAKLRKRPFGNTLRLALGMASPCLEAWLLCGRDARASEAGWHADMEHRAHGRKRNRARERAKQLKVSLYGSRPWSLDAQRDRARAAALEACKDVRLLEQYFPGGFGTLAAAIRSWRTKESG